MRTTTFASLALLTSLAWIPAACSSSGGVTPSNDGGAPDTSPALDAQIDSELPDAQPRCVPSSVWTSTSAVISVSSFGFWEGSTGYEKKRADLTPVQEAALDGLCVIAPPTSQGADFTSYRITITDANGTVTKYRAAQSNVLDSDEGPIKTPTIDYDTLRPFLNTIHCLTASDTRGLPTGDDAGTGERDSGPNDPWSHAPTMTDDTACINGVFAPYTCQDIWLKVAITAAGDYDLATSGCFESLRVRVLSADGATELAASPTGTANACPHVAVHFDAAGTYPVVLEKKNVAGCTVQGTAGDFAIRISRVTP